jgi:hypothetical protein
MTSIDGVAFDEAYAHKTLIAVGGMALPVISVDHLIRKQLSTGRLKDLADVDALRTPSSNE